MRVHMHIIYIHATYLNDNRRLALEAVLQIDREDAYTALAKLLPRRHPQHEGLCLRMYVCMYV